MLAQDFEAGAMRFLSRPSMQSDPTIRIPQIVDYDRDNHVLMLEDAGPLPSLKAQTTEGKDIATCTQIGEAIGRFLAHLHNSTAGDAELLDEFNGNETAKNSSGKLYFGGLPAAAERFGYRDGFIAEAAKVGEEEVMQRSDVLTVGDFWTGNVLVSAPSSSEEKGDGGRLHLYVLDLELCKPGTAEFDIGQMAAEMYCLARFRKGAREESMALLDAFLGSYKRERSVEVDAAKVAIRIGAHLFVIMPMAWANEATEEEIGRVAEEGREFVRMGWERDGEALGRSVLASLT